MLPVAFDVRWRAASSGMRATCAQVIDELGTAWQRARRPTRRDASRFALAVGLLLCNVAAAQLAAPGARLAVRRVPSRSNPAYALCGGQFNRVLDLATEHGLLLQQVSSGVDELSTVRPTRALLECFPRPMSWSDITPESRPSIELRSGRDAVDGAYRLLAVPLQRDGLVARWARQMDALSARLQAALTIDERPYVLRGSTDGRTMHVDPTQHVRLVRVFNEDWEHGGRVFGGFWQSMPKRERVERLQLAGEPVCEIDYQAMLLRIAYAVAGVRWPFAGGDPYTAGGGSRAGWKRCTMELLFAADVRQWPGSAHVERESVRRAFPVGTGASEVYAAIRDRHAPIAEQFGKALVLFGYEADLMLTVLSALDARGIVAAPVHDSLLVADRHAAEAGEVMRACGRERLALFGVDLEIATHRAGIGKPREMPGAPKRAAGIE